MSGNIGGQVRALPFTGFTALPFIVIGLVLSSVGGLLTALSRKQAN